LEEEEIAHKERRAAERALGLSRANVDPGATNFYRRNRQSKVTKQNRSVENAKVSARGLRGEKIALGGSVRLIEAGPRGLAKNAGVSAASKEFGRHAVKVVLTGSVARVETGHNLQVEKAGVSGVNKDFDRRAAKVVSAGRAMLGETGHNL